MRKLLLISLSVILLISCSSTRGVYITDDIKVPLLDNSCFDSHFEMYQLMEGNVFGDDEYYLEAYSTFNGEELEIILLSSTGLSIAEVSYDGRKVTMDSQFFNNSSTAASYIIFDFQLCYGSFDSLNALFSKSGLQFSEIREGEERIRTLSKNDILVCQITISDCITEVNNFIRGYSYSMELL